MAGVATLQMCQPVRIATRVVAGVGDGHLHNRGKG